MRRGPRAPGAAPARRAAELYLQGGITIATAAEIHGTSKSAVSNHLGRLRTERGLATPERPAGEPTDAATPNLAQTIRLLLVSRGEQPSPAARQSLSPRGWLTRAGLARATSGGLVRLWALADAGRAALASSPFLEEAQRRIDAGRHAGAWR